MISEAGAHEAIRKGATGVIAMCTVRPNTAFRCLLVEESGEVFFS